ncbi:MAG: nucleotide pyrophosphatase/phosphodiesterase family protein [Granulosicoccus sp.]
MKSVLVILVVGLSPDLVGEYTPELCKLVARGGLRPLKTITPAVTCSVQSTLLTGSMPAQHGIVGNGWYNRESAEVGFWKQSNHLVSGIKLWERGRALNPAFTCAKMFWWYNMYSTADWSATPRPQYPADGRKIPDHYAAPAALHDELDARLGQFPLFTFWGPKASISSSRWISEATLHVMDTRKPTLTLTYLPHLDYNLQRLGPDTTQAALQQDLRDVDALCGELIAAADKEGREIVVVSEYGITPVSDAVHINRSLREAGLVSVRNESGCEQLDAGASEAFAVADHQLAHIYIKNSARIEEVRKLLTSLDGVERVLGQGEIKNIGLDHARSGELVAISTADRWFSYYYWLDEARAPDYARTVDIHRKPGYDPVELFIDPEIRLPLLKVGSALALRKLGMRRLLDVISPSATQLVKGSHGRPTDDTGAGPLVIASQAGCLPDGAVSATDFSDVVLAHCFGADKVRLNGVT